MRETRSLARHLVGCAECGPVFASLARAVDGLRSLGHLAAPPATSVAPAVVERIAGGAGRRRVIAVCLEPASLRRTVTIALVVGAVLTAINQADALLTGAATLMRVVKVALNFAAPFVVSNLGLLAARSSGRIAP